MHDSATHTNVQLLKLIRELLASFVMMDPDDIDISLSFTEYGLGSVEAALLLGELEGRLNRRLSPLLVYDHPTAMELAEALSASDTGRVTASPPMCNTDELGWPWSGDLGLLGQGETMGDTTE